MTPRRRILLRAAALGSTLWLPAFGPRVLGAAQRPDDAHSAGDAPRRRLVLVELAGANDGLNTVVPWQDDAYHRLRPTLALSRDELLPLPDSALALHRALAPLQPAFDAGELSIVQGLGYPRPNRSHFASIGYWDSGGDGERGAGENGWLVHDIEQRLANPVRDAHGISLEGPLGPLRSPGGRWLSAASVAQLATLQAIAPDGGADAQAHSRDPIVRMRQRMQALDGALDGLQQRIDGAPALDEFRGGALGAQLREVARFVLAGLDTPVYRVRLGGFDTHERQRGRHERRLRQLGLALADLRSALLAAGQWEHTLVMTYSEFGRRAAENRSGGTDHGAAAPHLMLGGALGVQASTRVLGLPPDLAALVDGDVHASLDYRALYDRVLHGWLGVEDNRFASFRDPTLAPLFG